MLCKRAVSKQACFLTDSTIFHDVMSNVVVVVVVVVVVGCWLLVVVCPDAPLSSPSKESKVQNPKKSIDVRSCWFHLTWSQASGRFLFGAMPTTQKKLDKSWEEIPRLDA